MKEKKPVFVLVLPYLFGSILVLTSVVLNMVLTKYGIIIEPFLLYVLAITFSTWYGGFRIGIAITFLSALSLAYFSLSQAHVSPQILLSNTIELALFIGNGILVSYIIEKYKKTDIYNDFKEKEEKHLKELEQLRALAVKAKAEIQARDEFLSIVSHELRTPLTSMLLQIQSGVHNIQNVSLANFSVQNLLNMLESIEKQSQRMSKMINDLLNVSLMTTGKLELEKQEADIVKLTQDIINQFKERLHRENIELFFYADGPIVGLWDTVRIEQVLTNLISNAIKYGDHKPITISVGKKAHTVEVTIEDQGIGIPADKQKQIFKRFERAVTNHAYKGLGVGLYITQQIIAAHGGNISVKSKEGYGSSFTITLPLGK